MTPNSLSRRILLAGIGAGLINRVTAARAEELLVVATYPGAWEQAARTVIVPAFRTASHAGVTVVPSLALDSLAKLMSARAHPPFDVVVLDPPISQPALDAGLLAPLPLSTMKNAGDVPKAMVTQNGCGIASAFQIYGLAYNPQAIKTAPSSWEDLWSPAYKGRVTIVGPETTIGCDWFVRIAKLHGGSETNLEPGWTALAALKPNLATIAPNPGALGPMFQQGQIDLAVGFLSVVEPMRSRGVDVALSKPSSGWGVVTNNVHIVANAENPALAAAYIDAMLSPDVQTALSVAPYYSFPTNAAVAYGANAGYASSASELSALASTDWSKIVPQRKEMVARFNRDFRKG